MGRERLFLAALLASAVLVAGCVEGTGGLDAPHCDNAIADTSCVPVSGCSQDGMLTQFSCDNPDHVCCEELDPGGVT